MEGELCQAPSHHMPGTTRQMRDRLKSPSRRKRVTLTPLGKRHCRRLGARRESCGELPGNCRVRRRSTGRLRLS
ncbi:unnamed protein product, partial [Polarella glacialis]